MISIEDKDLHTIVFGLLYPGGMVWVLRTYVTKDIPLFISNLYEFKIMVTPRLYFGLVFIFHWALIFTYFKNIDPSAIHPSEYLTHAVGLIFMILSFSFLPLVPEPTTVYFPFYLSVSGIGSTHYIYGEYRVYTRQEREDHPLKQFNLSNVIEFFLMVWGILFAILELRFEQAANAEILVHIFITGTLFASILTLKTLGFIESS